MNRWKKMIHNCPYLVALAAIWLFLTIGGVGLMIYRGYGELEWKSFWSSPFFALVMEEELQEGMGRSNIVESVMAMPSGQSQDVWNHEEISHVIPYAMENNGGKLNDNIISDTFIAADRMELAIETEHVEEERTEPAGKTVFVTYTPVETNSVYYRDAGKIALTTEYAYTKVEEDYFEDAAFLGDSRTMGISDYSGLDADFYCENGMTIYKLLDEKGVTYQKTGEKVDLNQVLQQKKYGKIYIMLGMNELGYRDTGYFQERYREVLEQIRQWQPQAVIFLMANLHVSQAKNNIQTEFNNININAKNVAAASLADGIDVFYLDSNPLFTNEDGLLKDDITFDGVHLYANNYLEWKGFLMEHGVIRKSDGNENDGQ